MTFEFPYQVQLDDPAVVLISERPDLADFYPENFIYAGSHITILERAVITLSISDPSLIDTDHRWFEPKQYLGTYQILEESQQEDDDGNPINLATGTDAPQSQGRLCATRIQISRIQELTIGDLDRQPRLDGVVGIDGCNTSQVEATLTLPGGITVATTDFQESVDIFLGRTYRTTPDIQSIFYRPILLAIGLYLYPGVSFVSASLFLEAINVISDDAEIQVPPDCEADATCAEQFDLFVEQNPNVLLEQPPGIEGIDWELNFWECPSEPGTGFSFYLQIAI